MVETALHVETRAIAGRDGAPLDPCVLVIFGATGDLARRKLVPALYALARDEALPPRFAVVGVSRGGGPVEALRGELERATARFSRSSFDAGAWRRFSPLLEHVPGDTRDPASFRRLAERLAEVDRARGTEGRRIFYLATPPSEFASILRGLAAVGALDHGPGRPWTRVVIEKPFGRDLASARALNELVASVLDERQVFRIDHYLGKETVQNILVFRFGNAIFEQLWSRRGIDHVEITAAETLGVAGRGRFYEETGVLRDMVQNHLLQVLACCGIEAPVSFAADDVRDEKVRLFRSIRRMRPDEVARDVVLGQYRGYREERDVAPGSRVATFAALRLFIDSWRWQGVPFYVRTGKRLARRLTEIAVHFRSVPLCLFGREGECPMEPNVLVLTIQPEDGISLRFACKAPGDEIRSSAVTMDMSYARAFGSAIRDPYERLLRDVMRGDATLFWRRDEVERAWELVTPILEAVEGVPGVPVHVYEPGSAGPDAAAALLGRDGRCWRPLAA